MDKRVCGAKNRQGGPCSRKPMTNGRCHFHGGKSPGAPVGNSYALKHGQYTQAAIDERRMMRAMVRDARFLMEGMSR